jgi:hypothetical protein
VCHQAPGERRQGDGRHDDRREGKPESIRFEPAEINSGALGTCLRDVLQGIAFAKRNASSGLQIDVALPSKRP